MQLVIDVLFMAVFAIPVVRGWRRGFMKSILSLGRLVLSLVITILFGSAFAGWIDATFINPPVYEAVSGRLTNIAAEVTASTGGGIDALIAKIPESFRSYLDLEAVDPTAEINALVAQWSRTIADGISRVISLILGFVLLFVISFVLLTVAIFIVNKLVKLPAIQSVDKILGLVVGVFSGAVTVVVLSILLSAILGLVGLGTLAEGSFMLRLFAGVKDLIFK